ncbi:MAG: S41 family peptidase [Bacteroidales bacterium]|nr:S41 family peptidase [Bacteroidales bacterium]
MKLSFKNITASLALGSLVAASAWAAAPARNHDQAVSRKLTTFNAIVRELSENYVDTLPVDRAFDMAITGLMMSIDPYTEYFTSEEREGFKTMTTGQYGGIGSYIQMRPDSLVYISGPYEGSPAARAGLRTGDLILKIDSTDVTHAGTNRVSTLLRGQPGTILEVTVQRPYATPDSILTIPIKREKLDLPSVPYYGVTHDNIGYIRLTSYMEKSPQEVRKALEEFKANPDVKGIVLDLRGNGGGLVESAVEIVNFFVPKGTEVLRMKGREKGSERIYKTTKQPLLPDMPLAVLIDGASASASEITAGALQDLDRAVLIGSRSFGKGLVQSTRPLPYDGMLKVTTAKYYIPSGRLIQALDYSRRNPDGSVAATPDSLCNTFTTRAGRLVKDGGGLQPDIKVEWPQPAPLTIALVRDNWIFDYGTRFAASHPTIAAPQDFVVTDEIYEDFKKSIDPARLKYDKKCEDLLANLRATAEKEGYLNDSTAAAFDALAPMLTHELQRDLDTHRRNISSFIADDLLGRYYYNRGQIIGDLKEDEATDRAAEILTNPARYREILSAPKPQK